LGAIEGQGNLTMPAREPWAKRHFERWERVAGTVPGLQLIHVDERHFELRISLPHLEEALIIGRPVRHEVIAPSDNEVTRAVQAKRPVPQAKVHTHPEVELTDDEIDRVLEYWRRGESAAIVAATLNLTRPPESPAGGGYPAM
jgi:hypothetical protein